MRVIDSQFSFLSAICACCLECPITLKHLVDLSMKQQVSSITKISSGTIENLAIVPERS